MVADVTLRPSTANQRTTVCGTEFQRLSRKRGDSDRPLPVRIEGLILFSRQRVPSVTRRPDATGAVHVRKCLVGVDRHAGDGAGRECDLDRVRSTQTWLHSHSAVHGVAVGARGLQGAPASAGTAQSARSRRSHRVLTDVMA